MVRRKVATALLISVVLTAPTVAQQTAPVTARDRTVAQIGFTTLLREGPGSEYRVIDEALTDQSVAVLGCAGGWCRISYASADGYVAEHTLTGIPKTPYPPAPETCFVNRMAGYHGGPDMRFCNPSAR